MDVKKKRDYHPSASYLSANNASPAFKNVYRTGSVIWNRIYGNNVQPDAVTDKIAKPKYDKKEREIWNN